MPRKSLLKKFLFWLVLALTITIRYILAIPVYSNGDRVRITETITGDPIKMGSFQYIKIAGLKVYLPINPEITYGDIVTVEGTVDAGILNNPKLLEVKEKAMFLSGLRNAIVDLILKTLPEPEGGLMAGMLIGSKSALLKDFYSATKNVGVTHVIVASGTNITFVASFLITTLSVFLSRRKVIYIVILGIILYIFISGFEAPLIRAGIMSAFLFWGQSAGRLTSPWRLFFITVFLMLFYKPTWITDVGFILSFVSTASLMLFEKRIRLRLKRLPEIIKESLSTSLAAQIGAAPVIFITFGRFNILSPLVNALVLWTVPIIMILGAVGVTLGIIFFSLGKFVLWLAFPFLWWFTHIVALFNF